MCTPKAYKSVVCVWAYFIFTFTNQSPAWIKKQCQYCVHRGSPKLITNDKNDRHRSLCLLLGDAMSTCCFNLFWDILKIYVSPTFSIFATTGELGYDRLSGTSKIGPSYAKSVVYIWRILDMHWTGTKHIVRHMRKSVIQWSVISKFTCTYFISH